MAEVAPTGSKDSGNTKPRPNSCINWFFTWNNYPSNWNELIGSNGSIIKYAMQEETGENGTRHIQGCVHLDKKRRWSELNLPNSIHWEKCQSWPDAVRYCTKDETRTGQVLTKGLPKPIKLINPTYAWEQEILSIISTEPDDRKIYWYWEPNGCTGKTSFCKYLAVKHGAIPLDGKKNDILYCAAEFDAPVYTYILSRSAEGFVSYDALEKIKDGFYMCGKYESKPIIRNSPHLFVFANFPPNTEKLSADRWIIKEITVGG